MQLSEINISHEINVDIQVSEMKISLYERQLSEISTSHEIKQAK